MRVGNPGKYREERGGQFDNGAVLHQHRIELGGPDVLVKLHGDHLAEDGFKETLESFVEAQRDGLAGGIEAMADLNAGSQIVVARRTVRALRDEGTEQVERIDLAGLALDDTRFAGQLFKELAGEEDFSDGQVEWAGGIVRA